jgi:hypothetical protein
MNRDDAVLLKADNDDPVLRTEAIGRLEEPFAVVAVMPAAQVPETATTPRFRNRLPSGPDCNTLRKHGRLALRISRVPLRGERVPEHDCQGSRHNSNGEQVGTFSNERHHQVLCPFDEIRGVDNRLARSRANIMSRNVSSRALATLLRTRWKGGLILLGILIIIGTSVDLIVGLPLFRTAGYRAMVQEYAQAVPVIPTRNDKAGLKWNEELPVSAGIRARIQARGQMDVVRIEYSDETQARTLYEYEDYSSPIAVRVTHGRLFVYWSETLIHTDWWLLAYDLAHRRELERRRVDPRDMPSIGGNR